MPTDRKYVTAPSGWRYSGRHPQAMLPRGEGPYIAALGWQLRGACEVVVPLGRADVATDAKIFEVEPVRTWRSGARQVLAYAAQTRQEAALALFGKADYLPIYLWLRDRMPAIGLWVWRDGRWNQVWSRREASYRRGYDVLPADPAALPRPPEPQRSPRPQPGWKTLADRLP